MGLWKLDTSENPLNLTEILTLCSIDGVFKVSPFNALGPSLSVFSESSSILCKMERNDFRNKAEHPASSPQNIRFIIFKYQSLSTYIANASY